MKNYVLIIALLLLAACADTASAPQPNPHPPTSQPDRECPRADGQQCL